MCSDVIRLPRGTVATWAAQPCCELHILQQSDLPRCPHVGNYTWLTFCHVYGPIHVATCKWPVAIFFLVFPKKNLDVCFSMLEEILIIHGQERIEKFWKKFTDSEFMTINQKLVKIIYSCCDWLQVVLLLVLSCFGVEKCRIE